MERQITSWYSPRLQREMPVAVYGNYGFALLLVPTAAADYLEYERFQLIDALAPFIDAGRVKVFSINSINNESWLNNQMEGRHKIIRHQQFNEYVYEEVLPFVRTQTSDQTPVIICGASFGALHSMNLFLKRPDLIQGVIAMSGVYDLTEYTKGYYDEDVYFNSPQHYIPNLTDHHILEQIRGPSYPGTDQGQSSSSHFYRQW
jgi:esterase/lipase superfamily enzyme